MFFEKTYIINVRNVRKVGEGGKMRRYYLDNIRWITVALVVIYHVIYIYNGVQPNGVIGGFSKVQYQDAFQYIVYPWFMALLFVVSGISARLYLDNHTEKEFIKTRTRKLLVPSTIGVLVFGWVLGYYNMQISNASETMQLEQVPKVVNWIIMSLSGIGVLWYIQVLWVLSMLLILVRKIEKDRLSSICSKCPIWVLLIMTPLVYLAAQVLNTPMITVYRFGIYGFMFLVGYYIFYYEDIIDKLAKYWYLWLVIAVVLGGSYTYLNFGKNYAMEPVINSPLACVYCWIAILAILACMKKWANKTSEFAKFMGQKSWGLYIFHYLPLAVVAYYLKQLEISMPVLGYYLVAGLASFIGAFVLNEIISRIPFLRWCILGIKK